jgi:hypothetical protein
MSAESILSALKITMWRYLMAHRPILNDKQRNTLYSIPTREHELLQYYVLSNEDIFHINTKRKVSNRLGFALQLCAFRYPGRLLRVQWKNTQKCRFTFLKVFLQERKELFNGAFLVLFTKDYNISSPKIFIKRGF